MEVTDVTEDTARANKQDKRRKVFVKVNFLKVTDIDTIKEVFHADVFVQTRWRESSLDGSTKEAGSNADFSKYWNPKIVISNSAPNATCKTWKTVSLDKSGHAYITEKRRIKGLFAENLELHEFPFDVQDLSIVVSSELNDDVIAIVEDEEEISAVNVVCFVDDTEWTICDLVYSEPRSFNKEISDTQFKNPALLVKCVAKRQSGFFLYNIILIMTMITTLSFTTFGVDVNLTQNRLQLSFIITLTGVTFKMVSNQSIPKIPYLTHLDRVILGSMVFNWLVCVWHGIISLYENKDDQMTMDFWAFISFIVLYVLFNIVLYLLIIVTRVKRHYQIKDRETQYQEKAIKLMGSSWKSDRQNRRYNWRRRNKIDGQGQFSINV